MGGLAAVWRPVLEPELATADRLVVDLRSGAYAALARVPGAVDVRVLREEAGRRTVDARYSLHVHAPTLAATLRGVVERSRVAAAGVR